jgi:serine/threonine protein kinase
MTHGDIKPQNVLLFRDKSGAIFAKLADFGYSGWDMTNNEKALIKLPRSRPWDAPEHHHRGFTVAQARKSDIYSFGMLCMYIIFEDKLCGATLALDGKNAFMSMRNYVGAFKDPNITDKLKHGGGLLELMHILIEGADILSTAQEQSLSRFFDSALAYDPEERILNIEELTSLLREDW